VESRRAVVAAPLSFEAWAVRGGAPEAYVIHIGMGPEKAARSVARLTAAGARAIAVAGVCGAVDPSLVPGDVLVADALLGPDGERIALDAAPLAAALARRGVPARVGAIAGARKLFGGPSRASLAARRACAVDVESFWVAPVAAHAAFAVLRVVSDGPQHELLRPSILWSGWRALRRLRAAAPALVDWADVSGA
jgi:4-hydroxy-3-methylbut-2-en-1-yl diphosphate reductase